MSEVQPQIVISMQRNSQISNPSQRSQNSAMQKQQLRKQISFLKQQVKKLKIDQLNQKVQFKNEKVKGTHQQTSMLVLKNDSQQQQDLLNRSQQHSLLNKQQQQNLNNKQQRNLNNKQQKQEFLLNQNKDNSENKQINNENNKSMKDVSVQQNGNISVNFRIGRIVKNTQRQSIEKASSFFSKTIQVRSNHSDNKSNHSNNKISHSNNKSIHSNDKNKSNHNNSKSRVFEQKSSRISLGMNTVDKIQRDSQNKSHQIFRSIDSISRFTIDNEIIQPLGIKNSKNERYDKDLIKLKFSHPRKEVSKSETTSTPQPLLLKNNIFANPESQIRQQKQQIPRQKNINIRKISYKLRRRDKDLKKQDFLNNYIKIQADQQNQQNVQTINSNIKFEFQPKMKEKTKIVNKNKISSLNNKQTQQLKKGIIIKNIGQSNLDSTQQKHILSGEQQIQSPQASFSLTSIPFFAQSPDSKSNQEQIIQLTLKMSKKLQIKIKRQQLESIIIKKYRNCLVFYVENYKVVWHYDGKFYFGDGNNQGIKEGNGVEFLNQHFIYKGQFINNKKHGSGILLQNNGDIYQGQWINGQKHGAGKFLDSQNNSLYQGQFKNGKFDGFGTLKLKDNQLYKGTFSKGIKQGFGRQIFKNNDKYKGEYMKGKFHGKGNYTWSGGSTYSGDFHHGIRTGHGKWVSSRQNGDTYIGDYINQKKQGQGKYYWSDGSIFQGHFQNDQKHGEGVLKYASGKVVQGVWEFNKLIKVIDDTQNQIIELKLEETPGNQLTKSKILEKI